MLQAIRDPIEFDMDRCSDSNVWQQPSPYSHHGLWCPPKGGRPAGNSCSLLHKLSITPWLTLVNVIYCFQDILTKCKQFTMEEWMHWLGTWSSLLLVKVRSIVPQSWRLAYYTFIKVVCGRRGVRVQSVMKPTQLGRGGLQQTHELTGVTGA